MTKMNYKLRDLLVVTLFLVLKYFFELVSLLIINFEVSYVSSNHKYVRIFNNMLYICV
ncbi:hypothetical protein GLOIN_2v1621555 [Rhizophagus irregularis DAOM 181602=DAOM 197198]|uniref:Uncharacterized protein n=1 Tax=Rhizophagus irregularis (strain DAOM 181602 / DAOM 197198 / MUCL 43194) TaxID=747089 RepID=A0A2P4PX71_RHIID|nr:hypothetical protein GLOIN_2v1621555 [Rhizophagus irregularis DAOM 181602=DAOM 197198]POG69987.1 hypothetical protein GLOIN_2v1621555 [Rhizophagus irregularis DAOM 181602=DAOM 197198]|eukprot:XP_025176853.1 hypothetical protein GLOIN_2v1621555 [Rhizophagus irregularis DAOM 181602=DAOM 197198]